MRQHHTKVHGEPLPNRECKGCDAEFYDSKARRKFCDDCNPNAGPHNGNWKDAKEVGECRICGDTFEFYPSDKPGIYCRACVEDNDEFLGDAYWEVRDIEHVKRVCEQCNEEMILLKSYVDRDSRNGRFCSHECRCLAMKESNETVSYNEGWAELRRKALDRDEHTCQECGVKKSELDYDLDVHHIKPVREFDTPEQAHELSNVICLCRSCHIRLEWRLRSINTNPQSSARNH